MAHKRHRIGRYAYAVESGSGFGRMRLWNTAGEQIGEIGFIEAGRALPNPKLAPDLSHGVGFFHEQHLMALVDMLRNEQAIYLAMSDEPPGFLSIQTETAADEES